MFGVKGAGVSRSSETQVSGQELITFWMKEIPSAKDAKESNFAFCKHRAILSLISCIILS
jgi:hypothetical protein